MADLSTANVAERYGVSRVTVNVWCLNKLFPNAKQIDTPRGPVWSIPESDLVGFSKPKRGGLRKSKVKDRKPGRPKGKAKKA